MPATFSIVQEYLNLKFIDIEANQPAILRRKTYVEFAMWLRAEQPAPDEYAVAMPSDSGPDQPIDLILNGQIHHAVVDSLQIGKYSPKDSQSDWFVHTQATLHWSAYLEANRFSTEQEHICSGPLSLQLAEVQLPKNGALILTEPLRLAFACSNTTKGRSGYDKIEAEIQRIPKDLYRKLVEQEDDERLQAFPYLCNAYHMAEYLVNEIIRLEDDLLPRVQRPWQHYRQRKTLRFGAGAWLMLSESALLHEINYQLFLAQIVSRWPNFRLHYRIIPRNGPANEAQEGWILPQQLQCFAYQMEPFLSLVQLLVQYGPEQAIELYPPDDRPHEYVRPWLLQHGGKIRRSDGRSLFRGCIDCMDRTQLTFYL